MAVVVVVQPSPLSLWLWWCHCCCRQCGGGGGVSGGGAVMVVVVPASLLWWWCWRCGCAAVAAIIVVAVVLVVAQVVVLLVVGMRIQKKRGGRTLSCLLSAPHHPSRCRLLSPRVVAQVVVLLVVGMRIQKQNKKTKKGGDVVMCKCGLHPGSPIQTSTDGITSCLLCLLFDIHLRPRRTQDNAEACLDGPTTDMCGTLAGLALRSLKK